MYRAVMFDFDGTIIDTEQHLFNIINKHLEMHNVNPISIDFYRSSTGGAAADLHDHLVRTAGSENKDKLYEEHHLTSTTLPMIDAIKSLMASLKQHHIPMTITTSSVKAEIMPTFKALGLDDYIEVVVSGEDVEQVKPNPRLYLSAVQQLNYMPTQCLAIEGSVSDATAAIVAGLDVIVNTDKMTNAQDFSSVDYVVRDTDYDQIVARFFTK